MGAEQEILEVPRRTEADLKSAIFDFVWQLKRQNYSDDTVYAYDYSLRALADVGIDLFNPETFLEKMPKQQQWSEIRKYNLAKAYRCFLNLHKIEAQLPKYRVTRPLPYIPPEVFLDQLIACCNETMAAFLQTLKETASRPGEAWKMRWEDLDIECKKLAIAFPEKKCNPRIRPISERLLRMLLTLPRKPDQKRIFAYKTKGYLGSAFRRMRLRAIKKLGNPELKKIDFYTFRYWRATLEYGKTGDFGKVMVLLGHKSLRYVLLYAQLSEAYYVTPKYISAEAETKQECRRLIDDGFEYVMDKDGVSLFRKLK